MTGAQEERKANVTGQRSPVTRRNRSGATSGRGTMTEVPKDVLCMCVSVGVLADEDLRRRGGTRAEGGLSSGRWGSGGFQPFQ